MSTVYALWLRNMKAFIRDRTRMIFSLVFPFFFIFVFSQIFANDYIENPIIYMLAGIIIMTVFDVSLRISSSTIDDMTTGFMKEVLVSPVSRLSVAAGQFVSCASVATVQALLIYAIGFFIGYRITSLLTVFIVVVSMVFVGLVFAGFGLFIATRVRDIQTYQIVSMAITMPMTFISGAYIPLSGLPITLQYVAIANPMTYAVSMFRAVSLEKMTLSPQELLYEQIALKVGGVIITPAISFLILTVFGVAFMAASTLSFINADFSRINRDKGKSIEW